MSRPATLRSAKELALGKPCGIRIKYMGGCRCLPCRAANSRYETERLAMRKMGLTNRIVSADEARVHLARLSRRGVGYKTAADVAGVARSVVAKITSGERVRIREETERSILAVTPDAARGRALVNARPTWRRIDWLLEHGARKAWIAKALGYRVHALQLNRRKVTAENARRVRQLYEFVRFNRGELPKPIA